MIGALAAAVLRKMEEMGPQGLANSGWGLAKLGIRHRLLMDSLALLGTQRMAAFDAQNLSNMAWAYAKMSLAQEPLFDAISLEVCQRSLRPRELANIAWCFVTMRRCQGPFLATLAAATAVSLPSFQPLDLANAAWSFSTASVLSPALANVVSQRSVACLELMDTQPLVNLVDLELPAGDLLLETLLSRVDAFFKEWIQEDAFANSGILLRWHIDNFGIGGTSHLLSKFGIRLPQQDVIERAQAAVQLAPRQRVFSKGRVSCYLEYKIGEALQGSFIKENSFQGEGTRAGRAGLLQSWELPISGLVDRSLCAEFQALSELCDRLDDVLKELRAAPLSGTVSLWTSGASCLSCVRAMRQFRQIFPKLQLEVSGPR